MRLDSALIFRSVLILDLISPVPGQHLLKDHHEFSAEARPTWMSNRRVVEHQASPPLLDALISQYAQ